MHDDEVAVDEPLVRALLDSQFPQYATEPLRVVEPWGTDNAIWRLGDDLVVRFPRIGWAAGQVDLEAEWLPRLAPFLDVEIPSPVAVGAPGLGYPSRWSVHRWVQGDGATLEGIDDAGAFALDLARVIAQLNEIPTHDAPPARNRARPLADYDAETRRAVHGARDLIDAEAALSVWEAALDAAPHSGAPVWVHGDLEGNCIVREGRLAGLVDWGSACAGDPAVDVQVAWSPLFTDATREAFLGAVTADAATIARARGAAIHQACAAYPYYLHTYPLIVERCRHKLTALGVPLRDRA
jgi:aminoglycoside phosphotransferase (APT) family kinase protein